MFCLNTDMMQCAVNHGAVFDDPFMYKGCSWNNSLYDFWRYSSVKGHITDGVTTDKIINTIRFALEHGAKIVGEEFNFYEQTEKWVRKDNIISPKDEELLNLIKEYS